MNLLMISGDRSLAAGKQGAFYNTLSELHKHFERIDVICPRVPVVRYDMSLFGNVFVHPSPWPLILQPLWIWRQGLRILKATNYKLQATSYFMTVHDYAPLYNGIGARLLRQATGLPYLLEIMHIPGVPRASGIRERLYRWLTRMFIAWDARPARAVRVINEHQTPNFLVAAGVPREKLLHIPAFYIDLEVFKPAEVPKQYDVAFVGRLAPNKGLNLFLDVIRLTGLKAVVVGDGPLLNSAKLKAKSYKLQADFVGFAKDSTEIARYLNESKLLLMPSLNEGGPRVILEAMACGVPVVATPVGIVPDILPPECIEEWNTGDIADKVRNVLQDESLYQRLSQQGLVTVRRFERVAAIKEYADALKRMAKS